MGHSPVTANAPGWGNRNANHATTNSAPLKSGYWQPKSKGRKRNKKHTQSIPSLRPDEEWYEAQAAEDPFEGSLPTMAHVLEPVEKAPVLEDLWADYKNQPPLPLRLG